MALYILGHQLREEKMPGTSNISRTTDEIVGSTYLLVSNGIGELIQISELLDEQEYAPIKEFLDGHKFKIAETCSGTKSLTEILRNAQICGMLYSANEVFMTPSKSHPDRSKQHPSINRLVRDSQRIRDISPYLSRGNVEFWVRDHLYARTLPR